MNYIDIILIIILFFSFAIGWKFRGIYLIVIPVAFFTGIVFANVGYPVLAALLKDVIPNETKRMLISYTLVFLSFAGLVVVAGMLVTKFFDFFQLTIIDRVLGAIIFISVIIIPVYFLFTFLDRTAGSALPGFHESIKNSLFFPAIQKYVFFIIKLPALKHLAIIETILK